MYKLTNQFMYIRSCTILLIEILLESVVILGATRMTRSGGSEPCGQRRQWKATCLGARGFQ